MDLSKLKGEGGAKPTKKKSDKPLLNTISKAKVDLFCQGKGIRAEGQDLMNEPKAEIEQCYLTELFNRNAGVAGANKTYRAVGNDSRDSVTVYHNTRWSRAVLQDGVEEDPSGAAKVRELKNITGAKYNKCFEEHLEIKLDTTEIPATLKDEFILDMIAVLNKYHKASCLKKVLRFSPAFEANRYEIITPEKNLLVNQHMPISVVVK